MRRLIAAFAAVMLLLAGLPAAAAAAPPCAGCCHQAGIDAGNAPAAACCRLIPQNPLSARETDSRRGTPPTPVKHLSPASVHGNRMSGSEWIGLPIAAEYRPRAMRGAVLRI